MTTPKENLLMLNDAKDKLGDVGLAGINQKDVDELCYILSSLGAIITRLEKHVREHPEES